MMKVFLRICIYVWIKPIGIQIITWPLAVVRDLKLDLAYQTVKQIFPTSPECNKKEPSVTTVAKNPEFSLILRINKTIVYATIARFVLVEWPRM